MGFSGYHLCKLMDVGQDVDVGLMSHSGISEWASAWDGERRKKRDLFLGFSSELNDHHRWLQSFLSYSLSQREQAKLSIFIFCNGISMRGCGRGFVCMSCLHSYLVFFSPPIFWRGKKKYLSHSFRIRGEWNEMAVIIIIFIFFFCFQSYKHTIHSHLVISRDDWKEPRRRTTTSHSHQTADSGGRAPFLISSTRDNNNKKKKLAMKWITIQFGHKVVFHFFLSRTPRASSSRLLFIQQFTVYIHDRKTRRWNEIGFKKGLVRLLLANKINLFQDVECVHTQTSQRLRRGGKV